MILIIFDPVGMTYSEKAMNDQEMPYNDIVFDATSPKRELARMRDEIKVQMHLARAELKTQWEDLERQWTLLQSRLSVLEVAGNESKQGIGAAVQDLTKELKLGYARMRDALARV